MPPLGQAMVAVEGRRPPARCRSWIAVGPAEFMFSPRRWVSDDSHMNALWVRRGKQNLAEKVRKRGANGPAFWQGRPGATFSAGSLSGLSHNDCRRRLLTNRSAVRILFGEPNYLTTNSLPFWLTARRHGLAGNGQYCAKGLSPVRQLDRYPPPDLARWPHSRAPFSVSPITSARLVNCQAGSGCAGVNAKEALCFSGGFPTEPDAPLSHSWATFSVSPTGRALLVNCSAGTSFVIGPESQD